MQWISHREAPFDEFALNCHTHKNVTLQYPKIFTEHTFHPTQYPCMHYRTRNSLKSCRLYVIINYYTKFACESREQKFPAIIIIIIIIIILYGISSMQVRYCSVDCQRLAWTIGNHKKLCKKWAPVDNPSPKATVQSWNKAQ